MNRDQNRGFSPLFQSNGGGGLSEGLPSLLAAIANHDRLSLSLPPSPLSVSISLSSSPYLVHHKPPQPSNYLRRPPRASMAFPSPSLPPSLSLFLFPLVLRIHHVGTIPISHWYDYARPEPSGLDRFNEPWFQSTLVIKT